MIEYPKINSVYKRTKGGRFILDQFSQPEFEYLKWNNWVGTEKIEGMNIRVIWEQGELYFKGRTDRAILPQHLIGKLSELFNKEQMVKTFGKEDVCIYGEGFGKGIQNGMKYIPDGVNFSMFDIKIGDYWLRRDDMLDISLDLGICIVSEMFKGSLYEAIDRVRNGINSNWGYFLAEGLVLKPEFELRDRWGNRVMAKIKTKDFK